MFKGGLEKSKQLPPLYEAVAKMGGAEFLNAGSDVSTDGVDGLHLTSESEKKLGAVVAAKVKEILKKIYPVQQIDLYMVVASEDSLRLLLRAPYQISSTL